MANKMALVTASDSLFVILCQASNKMPDSLSAYLSVRATINGKLIFVENVPLNLKYMVRDNDF